MKTNRDREFWLWAGLLVVWYLGMVLIIVLALASQGDGR